MADQAFIDVGRHCSEDSCRQLDFLPFKCPDCGQAFCGEHWRPPTGHNCAKYDPAKADIRIPSCPLCSTPVSFPAGTDPNLTMDAHLSSSCPVLHPHLTSAPKPKPANECAAQKCKTKMIQPIQCAKCRGKFCPKHRFERDHACKGAETVAAAVTGGSGVRKGSGGALSKLGGGGKTSGGGGLAPTSLSGLAALRRAQQTASSKLSYAAARPTTKPSAASSSKSSPAASSASSTTKAGPAPPSSASAPLGSSANPLVLSSDDDLDVQTDKPRKPSLTGGKKVLAASGAMGKVNKRALMEQESARKALEARAKKGLLTEDEKVRYATLQALSAKNGGGQGGEGCVAS
ncbi:hypothetical protein JCM8097_007178 [Rhodosporidiobolus ruineniae]